MDIKMEDRVIYYTETGKESSRDANDNPVCENETDALAKMVYRDRISYYIKVGNDGKIFNPSGLFSEGSHNRFLKRLGKPQWRFTKVNNKIFDMYLSFLKTKNVAWLNNAQREMN